MLKMNLQDKVKASAPEPTPVVNSFKEGISGFKEKSPCNWNIKDLGNNLIEASNPRDGVFKGSRSEFNKRLRA